MDKGGIVTTITQLSSTIKNPTPIQAAMMSASNTALAKGKDK